MLAYVFVYSPSKFKVDGTAPLKRFEVGTSYERAAIAIAGGTEGTVGRGIYVIGSEAADLAPEIRELESRKAVDFDVYLTDDKDPWPSLVDPEPADRAGLEMRKRVRVAFPDLRDKDFREFHITRGV